MEAQLGRWRALLAGGAARVGWKIGLTDARVQRGLGLEAPVIGHLTLATTLVPGTSHSLAGATKVGVEPEVAIHLGRDVPADADRAYCEAAILGLGPALELIDIDGPFDDLERIVARNIFHRGVLFGITHPERAGGSLAGITVRNHVGAQTADAVAAGDLAELVRLASRTLGACGERLLVGDRIISGSLTPPVWVEPGDVASVDFGPLGALTLRFTAVSGQR